MPDEEIIRRDVVERAVSPTAVVEGFEIVEYPQSGLRFGIEAAVVRKALALQGCEEALALGVVVAVALGRHALIQTVLSETLTKLS